MKTLTQYGPEEGLRRLKESDPEVAKPLERLIEKPQETDEMKKKSLLYSLATLGVIASLVGVISFATPTRLTTPLVRQIQGEEITPESTDTA